MKIAQHFKLGLGNRQIIESVKRTTEGPAILTFREEVLELLDSSSHVPLAISRPFHGLRFISTTDPTDKSVGYFSFVRFGDEEFRTFWAKP